MTGKLTGSPESKFDVWQLVSKSLTLTREGNGSPSHAMPATVDLAAGQDSIKFTNISQRSWEQMVGRVFNGTLIMSEN